MMSSRRETNTGVLGAIALLAAIVLIAVVLPIVPGLSPATALGAPPAPKVIAVSPADNATNVPITQTFSITFDEEMNPATITAATIYILAETGVPLPATVTYDASTKTATLVPTSKLIAGKTYYLKVTPNVESSAGVGVDGAPLTYTYHMVSNTPPKVTAKSPADGSVNCPLNQTMTITLNAPMDPDTFKFNTFYVMKRGATATISATIAYDAATKTATLTPNQELEEAATYDVTVTGALGANGMYILGAPITWSFNTVLVQPPAVKTKSPSPDATDQPLDVGVTVTFDRAMNASTITTDTFFIQKVGGAKVNCVLTANESGTTLTPSTQLDPNTSYQVTLTGDIKSAKGASLIGAPVTWTFKTKDFPSPFSDVSKSYRYFMAIYQLSQKGIIGGFSDGTFRPSSTVTREQFAKLIVKALGFTVTGSEVCPFGDVMAHEGTDPHYPAAYIAVCAAHGVVEGKTPKIFAPYQNVTRYQAVTIVVRGIDSINRGLLQEPGSSYKATWNTDLNKTHGENARLAEFNGLLAGLPLSQLDPLGPMTRGEIAQLLWNVVQLLKN